MTEAPRLSAAPETGKWRIPHECAMGAVHHNRSQDLVRRGDRGVAHRNRSQDLVWRSVTDDHSRRPKQHLTNLPNLHKSHGFYATMEVHSRGVHMRPWEGLYR